MKRSRRSEIKKKSISMEDKEMKTQLKKKYEHWTAEGVGRYEWTAEGFNIVYLPKGVYGDGPEETAVMFYQKLPGNEPVKKSSECFSGTLSIAGDRREDFDHCENLSDFLIVYYHLLKLYQAGWAGEPPRGVLTTSGPLSHQQLKDLKVEWMQRNADPLRSPNLRKGIPSWREYPILGLDFWGALIVSITMAAVAIWGMVGLIFKL